MEFRRLNRVIQIASLTILNGITANTNATLVNNAAFLFNTTGSYFGMDTNADGTFQNSEKTTMSQFAPLALGQIQSASGSHAGIPDGSENPAIDHPWNFFGNTGMSQTTAPILIFSDDGAGNVMLDFSGWGITWNGIPNIPLGGDSTVPADTGIAILTCSSTCAAGDSYVLDYSAHIRQSDPSAKGGTLYGLHLEGTISTVPVPAAVWLFGSGLIGLIGTARHYSGQV